MVCVLCLRLLYRMPGTDQYVLGTPLFKSRENSILDNGKQVLIQADKADRENRYIKGMKVNGQDIHPQFLDT